MMVHHLSLVLLLCISFAHSFDSFQSKSSNNGKINYEFRSSFDYQPVHDPLLNKAITQAVDSVQKSVRGIRRLAYLAGATLDKGSENFKYAALHQATNFSQKLAEYSLVSEKVSRILTEYGKVTPSDLRKIDLKGTYLEEGCPLDYYDYCLPSQFRTLNGTCNNLENRYWGSSYVAFDRLLEADYSDQISKPRAYGKYNQLPNAREVSEVLIKILEHSEPVKHSYISEVFTAFAAFVFRDISHIPRSAGFEGYKMKCCDITADQKDHECYAALPTRADEYCMEYARSSPAPNPYCLLGRREQVNQATAYLDASPLYGTSDEDLEKIRKPNSYRISKAYIEYEPVSDDLKMIAELFVMEHNRIAEEINELNYNWDSERVFQEARRLVIAVLQHITYSEFLPILLGPKATKDFHLKVHYDGFYDGYEASDSAGIPNVGGIIMNCLTLLSEIEFDKSVKVYDLAKKHSRNNPYVSKKPKFLPKQNFDGLALAVLQGRDHGIAGYQHWRKFCNLTVFNRYSDLHHVLDKDVLVKLVKLYGKLDDVELIIAGMTEEPEHGSVLGPTFACLMSIVFSSVRDGDRFWYENDLPPSSFTLKQLTEIRKSSLSYLFCKHSKVDSIQPNVFLVSDYYKNAEIECNSEYLEYMDLSKFKSDSYSDKVLEETLVELFHRATKSTPHVYKDNKSGHSSGVRVLHSFLKATNSSYYQNTQAQKLEDVTWKFIKTHKDDQKENLLKLLSNVEVEEYLYRWGYPAEINRCLLEEWKADSPCDHTTPYRSYSGRCNNLHFEELGNTLQTYGRLAPPQYSDYYKSPRAYGVNGKPLPSARKVSVDMHQDTMAENDRYTLMLMQFGQFVDHDLGHAPESTGEHNEPLDCSSCYSNESVSEECFPIPIPIDDPFFPKKHPISNEPKCLPFIRSMAGQKKLGHRQQINQVSMLLDLSTVYGSDECMARQLRSYRRGLLKSEPYSRRGFEFLPRTHADESCRSQSKMCYLAGDLRCNEHPGLATLHTIFFRFHNNVVKTLAHYNRHWNDEQLFQEGRKICIAVYQRILYTEFLPAILGKHAMYRFGLNLKDDYYYDKYDKHCDPSVTNEFANAAFRFGHSLMKPDLPRYGENYGEKKASIHLRDHFFNIDIFNERGMLDELIRGLVHTKAEKMDHSLTSEVTNHLFEIRFKKFSGLDLAALNIQRGRDHGIPGYTHYIDDYFYRDVKGFGDLKKIFDSDVVHKLKKLYRSAEDIDLFTGGLLEKPLKGGLVGATFGKIIGLQFENLRKCDRFWHETSDMKIRFTEDQLHEIRHISMAKLLCASTNIEELQHYVFEEEDDFRNPKSKCEHFERMDFSKWKDFKYCNVEGVKIPRGRSAPSSPCTHCTCTEEGPICRTVKVQNCYRLTEIYGASAVKEDEACAAQCPWPLLSGKYRYKGDNFYGSYDDDNDDSLEYRIHNRNKFHKPRFEPQYNQRDTSRRHK